MFFSFPYCIKSFENLVDHVGRGFIGQPLRLLLSLAVMVHQYISFLNSTVAMTLFHYLRQTILIQ